MHAVEERAWAANSRRCIFFVTFIAIPTRMDKAALGQIAMHQGEQGAYRSLVG